MFLLCYQIPDALAEKEKRYTHAREQTYPYERRVFSARFSTRNVI